MNKKAVSITQRVCITAVFMAMNIILSTFSIPVPGGHFYLCDVAICTAAILFDPFSAFLVGGVGSFIGDLLFYPAAMFVSLLSHGLQALVISIFTRYTFKNKALASGIGVTVGAVIMVIGYTLGRAFVYSTPEYSIIKLPYEILQAGVGSVGAMLLCYKCGLIKVYEKITKKYSI